MEGADWSKLNAWWRQVSKKMASAQATEASDEFMSFFEANADCQRAFQIILRADPLVTALARVSSEDPLAKNSGAESQPIEAAS
jgi:hypothetical protein